MLRSLRICYSSADKLVLGPGRFGELSGLVSMLLGAVVIGHILVAAVEGKPFAFGDWTVLSAILIGVGAIYAFPQDRLELDRKSQMLVIIGPLRSRISCGFAQIERIEIAELSWHSPPLMETAVVCRDGSYLAFAQGRSPQIPVCVERIAEFIGVPIRWKRL